VLEVLERRSLRELHRRGIEAEVGGKLTGPISRCTFSSTVAR
jgi:hypothetical protein